MGPAVLVGFLSCQPALTASYLGAALKVLGPSLCYVSQWHDDASAALEFEADLDGVYVQGVDAALSADCFCVQVAVREALEYLGGGLDLGLLARGPPRVAPSC